MRCAIPITALACLVAGCSTDVTLPDGVFACVSDEDCPAGLTCSADRCRGGAVDGGPTDDAGGPSEDAGGVGPDDHVIFVLQLGLSGEMVGSTADASCRSQASAAGHPGTFRAFLSTSSESAADRLNLPNRVVRPSGVVVANTGADLFGGALLAAPDEFADAEVIGGATVWTGTFADGSAAPDTCGDWTEASGGIFALAGRSDSTTGAWLADNNHPCNERLSVYCVRVAD